ncbi:MAG: ATP-dependent RecD-like DNA helicase [Bdellovibrionota bacterium]
MTAWSNNSAFHSRERGKPADAGDPSAEGDELFRARVARITYRSEDTGFGVMRVEVEKHDTGSMFDVQEGPTTVVGIIPENIRPGSHIIARGRWQTHPKFGKQFKAYSLTETEPTGLDAIARYLASGAVKGFGPVLAERIIEAFGAEALEIIDRDPHRLLEVPGIGEKKLQEILAAWQQKKSLREVLLFFQNHNVSLSLAQRIYNRYGDRAIEIVQGNPYILARDVWGIGFQTADQIASALGIAPTSPERVIAGLLYTLKKGSDDGHCYLPREALLQKSAALLGVEDGEILDHALLEACASGDAVREEDRFYLPLLHQAERELAESLAERIRNLEHLRVNIPPAVVEDCIQSSTAVPQSADPLSSPSFIQLSPQQQEAIHLAATRSLLVITGGPGCGKTTIVRTITRLFQRSGINVSLAAPTGRAAQRLAEVCGLKASTIHRLLKFDPGKRSFVHNAETPLTVEALIVDESSMIDLPLAASLLAAVPASTRLIIVGDADQLPSVGPGLFLADLLNMPSVPRVRLNTLFRRASESLITEIAHEINAGRVPEIPEPDGITRSDAYFLRVDEPGEAASMVEKLVVDQIPKRFALRGSQITVLSPMNQGELGVVALNERLQAQLVPPTEGIPRIKVGNVEFRLGDRVCQRVNNYQITDGGVFNGDQGEVIGIDAENRGVIVKLWDGREISYPNEALYQLDLAYALTIHRSQGSEVPAVVLVLHESHSILLERQLLYTAVTRAKKLLLIVGTRKALVLATKKSRSKRRYTTLTERTMDLLR